MLSMYWRQRNIDIGRGRRAPATSTRGASFSVAGGGVVRDALVYCTENETRAKKETKSILGFLTAVTPPPPAS